MFFLSTDLATSAKLSRLRKRKGIENVVKSCHFLSLSKEVLYGGSFPAAGNEEVHSPENIKNALFYAEWRLTNLLIFQRPFPPVMFWTAGMFFSFLGLTILASVNNNYKN